LNVCDPASYDEGGKPAKPTRTIGTGEILAVKDVVLKRDAGTFTMTGTITFLAPVRGKVTGAVFFGHGTLELIPPIEIERKRLAELTKEPALHEEFDQAVFRFTDDTYEELKKESVSSPPSVSAGDPVEALAQVQKYLRKERKYNLDGRILEDVSEPGCKTGLVPFASFPPIK